MENYAVYVRVSTDREEQVSSVGNQIDICRNWLERNGFSWDEELVYKDEGVSGTVFIERPAIQSLLEKVKEKEIHTVVFKSISRLARDLKDSLEIREIFLSHGVRIISIEEGYDSNKSGKTDMAFELWSLFSAQYSRTLSSSISAALAAKVRRGEHIGKIPYGYNRVNHKLVIHEDEAFVVQDIYRWYNEGWGFKRISNELNRLGVLSKTKRIWQMTSVQRIIRNPIYKGTFVLNQYGSVKVNGRKKQIRNPKEKWLVFPHHHPMIVEESVWEQANDQSFAAQKTKITPWNEFRTIATCAVCGSNMIIVQSHQKKKDGGRTEWKYVKCSQYRRAGKHGCVNHAPISYEGFRKSVLQRMKEDQIFILPSSECKTNIQLEIEKKRIDRMIDKIERKQQSLLEIYLEEVITKQEFEKKRLELQADISKWEKEKEQIGEDHITEQTQDLFSAFQNSIQNISVKQNGEFQITYI